MSKKSKIVLEQGTVWDSKTGKGFTDFGDALDKTAQSRCCGVDCCEGTLTLTDVKNDGQYVIYVKNGVLTTATQAVYDADKAAGFV
jgi:hypothetical protein